MHIRCHDIYIVILYVAAGLSAERLRMLARPPVNPHFRVC